MYKGSTLIIFLFFSVVASAQQTTMDKHSRSVAQTDINITAVAIPMENIGNVVIDSATYHKVMVVGVEPVKPVQTVEISAPATYMTEETVGGSPKGEINTETDIPEKETIQINDRAIKVIPK